MPEQHREEFQRELAKLRDAAPTVSFKQMRKVIEDDLEEPIAEVFASFDEEPIAAASIGQVYRATLHDGREVAVKVQYPGVAGAVRADLQNLDMIMRLLKRMTPGLDVKAIAEEIKERIVEELDYELEAQNQRSLARIFAGHPFIVVPDVVSSLSRERVLVGEFVHGVGFEELKSRSQAERDRLGEIVFRFFLGCLYRHRQFSGDPHPGNFLLQDDGRVAFLDFGLFKRLDAKPVELELAAQRAVVERDAAALHRLLAESGFLPDPARVDPEHLLAFIDAAIWWYTTDETVRAVAGDRHAGDDRELRSALEPLSRDAPPGHAPRASVRPAHGDAHAGRPVTAAGERQLAQDRPRVDVRRRAGHRAGDAGGRVLRSQRRRRALSRCRDNQPMEGQTERAIRDQRLAVILDVLAEAVTIRALNNHLVYANQAALDRLGFDTVAELRAADPRELMGPYETTDEHGQPLRMDDLPSVKLLRGEEPEPLLMRSVNRASGEESWVLLKAAAVRDGDGADRIGRDDHRRRDRGHAR